MNWETRFQRQSEIGIMCGDKPWNQTGQKTVSVIYVTLETKGRRIVCSLKLRLRTDTLTTKELWRIMREAFTRPRKITLDSLQPNKSKGKQLDIFHEKLKEFSEECEKCGSKCCKQNSSN